MINRAVSKGIAHQPERNQIMTTLIETKNGQRAEYALEALSSSQHYDDSDLCGVQDLLSDLMHLCNQKEWDFPELLRVATDNFNAELLDPECNDSEFGNSTEN
jgi:hypothetical protein